MQQSLVPLQMQCLGHAFRSGEQSALLGPLFHEVRGGLQLLLDDRQSYFQAPVARPRRTFGDLPVQLVDRLDAPLDDWNPPDPV